MSKPFAAVVSLQDRLSVVGSAELLARVLPKHSPSLILPADWAEEDAYGLPFTFRSNLHPWQWEA